MHDVPDLTGWLPIRVFDNRGETVVDWCLAGSERLEAPFFSQSVERCLRLPFNLAFRHRTSIEVLEEWVEEVGSPPVAGLVFHMSRCGSTLVAQMLAARRQHVVISEAEPIEGVLRRGGDPRWVRAVVRAIGASQGPAAEQVFIKFDSWHILQLDTVRQAFPGVPWIFLYRDPVDVLASQAREPGAQTLPGALPPTLFGIDPAEVATMSQPEYGARVIGAICQHAVAQRDDDALFVNYRDLPDAFVDIAAHFGLDCDPHTLADMLSVAQYDAKAPSLPYDGGGTARVAPSATAEELARRWLATPYSALESASRGGVRATA